MSSDQGRGRGRGRAGARQQQQGGGGGPADGAAQAMGNLALGDGGGRGGARGGARGGGRGGASGGATRREFKAADYDLVQTREGKAKKGSSGQPINLLANYYSFTKKQERILLQYRVDLNIDEDRTFARKAIVRRIQKHLPQYLFDGT
jgi:hypothetical protein